MNSQEIHVKPKENELIALFVLFMFLTILLVVVTINNINNVTENPFSFYVPLIFAIICAYIMDIIVKKLRKL